MHKYIGRTVDILYVDRHSRFSQRRIKVLSIHDGTIRAYDTDRRAPRIFKVGNILAVQPVVRRAN